MSEGRARRFGCLRVVIEAMCLAYVLALCIYGVLRFIVQDGWWPVALLNSFVILLFLPAPLLILLALLIRSRRASFNLLLILVIAFVSFGLPSLPKNTPAVSGPSLRVMTLNILRLNPVPERILALVEQQQPDIIFLQEIERDSTQEATLQALQGSYPFQAVLADEMRLQHYTAINLTASRYPFILSEPVPIDAPGMPLLSRQVIDFNGQSIALYNIHLVAPVGSRPLTQLGDNYFVRVFLGYDDRQRNQQMEALLAHLEAEDLPFIVAGDFNTSATSMTYVTRLAPVLRDSFAEAGQGWGSTWPVAATLGFPRFLPAIIRMDYIFHSPGLTTVRAWTGASVGSDHLPVLADMIQS
jgi:vancomycin resistance protein VanJ